MITNALPLIKQLIERTKEDSLTWNKFSKTNIELMPVYTPPFVENTISLAVSVIHKQVLVEEESYVCNYNNGYFFLLLYRNLYSSARIELRAQTQDSKTSKVFATSTSDDTEISAQLKRLYNLVDNAPSLLDIDQFVKEFIDDK